jgi:hypothetical protein
LLCRRGVDSAYGRIVRIRKFDLGPRRARAASRPGRDGVRHVLTAPEKGARLASKKFLLRGAYRGRVPDSTLDGAKMGFAVALDAWFRGDLQGYAREVLFDSSTLGRGYLQENSIRSILDARAATVTARASFGPRQRPSFVCPAIHERPDARRI